MNLAVEQMRDVRSAFPPPREIADAPHEQPAVISHNGRARHVLILDDEPSIVEILSEVLADEGFRVTCCGTPPPIEEIARLAPDAIVLDLVFGGHISGLGFLAMLRSHPDTAATPVIVCTALADPGIAATLAQLRPEVQILTKPFDIEVVGAVVRRAAGLGGDDRPVRVGPTHGCLR